MTFEEKFNELKKSLIKADVKKFDSDFAIQITMNDDDCGGTFYAAYINKEYSVEPFDYFDNTASIDTSAEVISDIIAKKTDIDSVVYAGKMFVGGNINHVKNLFDSLSVKSAAKKTAEKKTATAKKPAAKKQTVKSSAKKSTEETKQKLTAQKPDVKPVVHSGTVMEMESEGFDVI